MTRFPRSALLRAWLPLSLLLAAPAAAQSAGPLPSERPTFELSDPSADVSLDVGAASRVADAARAARMQSQLEQRAGEERTSALVLGITNLGVGALLVGASIWLSVDRGAFGGGFGMAGLTGLIAAPLLLATGLYSLLGVGTDGDRLARWQPALAGELSALELARFEGELRAEARAARLSRWGSFALGVGTLASGLVTMVLGGALDGFDDELRGIVIGGGGGLAAMGAVLVGTSFLESSVEQMWNRYRRGEAASSAGLTLRPVLGLGGVGLVGTF